MVVTLHAATEHFYFTTLFSRFYNVTLFDKKRRDVCFTAVDAKMAVTNKLPRLGARLSKAHDIEDIIQSTFQKYQKLRTRYFLRT